MSDLNSIERFAPTEQKENAAVRYGTMPFGARVEKIVHGQDAVYFFWRRRINVTISADGGLTKILDYRHKIGTMEVPIPIQYSKISYVAYASKVKGREVERKIEVTFYGE